MLKAGPIANVAIVLNCFAHQYDPDFEKTFQGWVKELDPPVKCEDVTIRLLSSELTEMVALQHVLECAPGYAERVTGAPPGAADAQSTFTALPKGKTYEDKFLFGIFASNEMVGCIDLIRSYPTANAATLGLLLVTEQHQGMGIGRHAYALLERFASSWGNCDVIRLGVVMTNSEVLRFWRKLGFSETGETKPYNCGSVCSQTIIMEKPLQPGTGMEEQPGR